MIPPVSSKQSKFVELISGLTENLIKESGAAHEVATPIPLHVNLK
jgi:hypothetical protein